METQGFEQFWTLYPRRVAKKDALKAWNKLSDVEQTKAMHVIRSHVRQWEIEQREFHRIPHGATWLNGARFDDELEVVKPKPALEARPGESMEAYQARLRQHRDPIRSFEAPLDE